MSIAREISRFTRKEIDLLFTHARRIFKAPSMLLLAAPRTKSFGRILVSVSAKTANAPERNLIRRRIKAIFYEQELYALPFDIICLTRPGILKIPFSTLQQQLVDALHTAARLLPTPDTHSGT